MNHGGLRSRIGRTSGPSTLSTSIPPGLERERVESLRSSVVAIALCIEGSGQAGRRAAEEDEIRREQAVAGGAGRAQLAGHVDDLDGEAGGAQAVGDVGGVEADVVVLQERAAAVLRAR